MGAEIILTKPKRSTLKVVKDKTLAGLGNFIKLFPTGTVFLFRFLIPLLSNYAECEAASNRNMTMLLFSICGIICTFSCFTDSYFGVDGQIHYGIVTTTGIWPGKASGKADLSQYKIRVEDIVHAIFSTLIFGALALTDKIWVLCFHNNDYRDGNKLTLMVVPAFAGFISSFVFSIFPNKRHGIGYPQDLYSETPEE